MGYFNELSLEMKDKLVARLHADDFGRAEEDVQVYLFNLYEQEGLFANDEDWDDAYEIYLDEATSNAHYRQHYA